MVKKKKKADIPLCIRCQEDSEDLVEVEEYKRATVYFCNVCSLTWTVAKPDGEWVN